MLRHLLSISSALRAAGSSGAAPSWLVAPAVGAQATLPAGWGSRASSSATGFPEVVYTVKTPRAVYKGPRKFTGYILFVTETLASVKKATGGKLLQPKDALKNAAAKWSTLDEGTKAGYNKLADEHPKNEKYKERQKSKDAAKLQKAAAKTHILKNCPPPSSPDPKQGATKAEAEKIQGTAADQQ